MLFKSLALLALSVQQPAPDQLDAAAAAFSSACVESGGDRSKFNAVAKELKWTSVNAGLGPLRAWIDRFRAEDLEISLSHTAEQRGDVTIRAQTACSVTLRGVPAEWRNRLEAMEFEGVPLGPATAPDETYRLPSGFEVAIWNVGPDRIHATHGSTQDFLELSINYDRNLGR